MSDMQIAIAAAKDFIPVRIHPTDAGADLRANLTEPLTLQPGESAFIDTGIAVAIPDGYFGMLVIRSGLACKHGITLANSVGIIDSTYRGPIKAKLVNLGYLPYTIEPTERIAQLIIVPCVLAGFTPVETLEATERGEGGFGSTGTD